MQKQTEFYETQLKKHVKTPSQKLRFNLNFLVDPAIQNAVWFVTKRLAAFSDRFDVLISKIIFKK
jgi:hypothetical protein